MTYDSDGHLVPIPTADSPAGRPTVTGAVLMRPPYGTGGERWVQGDAASGFDFSERSQRPFGADAVRVPVHFAGMSSVTWLFFMPVKYILDYNSLIPSIFNFAQFRADVAPVLSCFRMILWAAADCATFHHFFMIVPILGTFTLGGERMYEPGWWRNSYVTFMRVSRTRRRARTQVLRKGGGGRHDWASDRRPLDQ